jgi:hypothetical protein
MVVGRKTVWGGQVFSPQTLLLNEDDELPLFSPSFTPSTAADADAVGGSVDALDEAAIARS